MSFKRSVALLLCVCGLLTSAIAADDVADRQTREKAFVEMLSNTTLVGSFTVDAKMDQPPKPERYEITTVTKLTDELWTLMTRVKYGNKDVTLPVTVPIVWAGDTPMVSMTDQSIPGLGDNFSARVVFHDGRYAGTWQHGEVGGHMFGRFEKTKTDKNETKK